MLQTGHALLDRFPEHRFYVGGRHLVTALASPAGEQPVAHQLDVVGMPVRGLQDAIHRAGRIAVMFLHRLGDERLCCVTVEETDLAVLAYTEENRVLPAHLLQPAVDGKDKVEARIVLDQAA